MQDSNTNQPKDKASRIVCSTCGRMGHRTNQFACPLRSNSTFHLVDHSPNHHAEPGLVPMAYTPAFSPNVTATLRTPTPIATTTTTTTTTATATLPIPQRAHPAIVGMIQGILDADAADVGNPTAPDEVRFHLQADSALDRSPNHSLSLNAHPPLSQPPMHSPKRVAMSSSASLKRLNDSISGEIAQSHLTSPSPYQTAINKNLSCFVSKKRRQQLTETQRLLDTLSEYIRKPFVLRSFLINSINKDLRAIIKKIQFLESASQSAPSANDLLDNDGDNVDVGVGVDVDVDIMKPENHTPINTPISSQKHLLLIPDQTQSPRFNITETRLSHANQLMNESMNFGAIQPTESPLRPTNHPPPPFVEPLHPSDSASSSETSPKNPHHLAILQTPPPQGLISGAALTNTAAAAATTTSSLPDYIQPNILTQGTTFNAATLLHSLQQQLQSTNYIQQFQQYQQLLYLQNQQNQQNQHVSALLPQPSQQIIPNPQIIQHLLNLNANPNPNPNPNPLSGLIQAQTQSQTLDNSLLQIAHMQNMLQNPFSGAGNLLVSNQSQLNQPLSRDPVNSFTALMKNPLP